MIPDELVEQISQQADIVAIIGEHVKLKKTGSVWRGPCPFHQGTNANFSVMPRGGYTCFVCGEKGSVFTFVQKRLGMSFIEAVKYVGAKTGIEVPEFQPKRDGPDPREPMWELHATVSEFFQHALWETPAGAEARTYLKERDVSRTTAERFAMGYAPRDVGAMRAHLNGLGIPDERLLAAGLLVKRDEHEELRPRFRDRLIFPIIDQSQHTVGFGGRLLGPGEPKYLNSGESEIFSKGKVLYNMHLARNAIRKEDRVLIVEGYFDALRLVEAGFEHVVAPMGTALTEAQAELLGRFTKQVVLLYDADAPGQKATFRAADVLLAKGMEVRVVTLPDGEDPDTFARSKGRAGLEPLIENAMDVFDRKVQLLQRAGWFNDLQHKRRALDRLLPTIRAASDPITRDLYLARAADAAGIAREVLLAELHAVRRGAGRSSGAAGSSGTTGRAAAPTKPAAVRDHSREPDGAFRDHSREPDGAFRDSDAPPPGDAAAPFVPSGPYKSRVEAGAAEQSLIRVLLTQPLQHDLIVEELGKLEADEFSEGESEAFGDDQGGVLRDPVYANIYEAAKYCGADAPPEQFTASLEPLEIYVYETLRGEAEAVVDAPATIRDAMRQLRGRSLDAQVAELKSLLPLADSAEKDRINARIGQLTAERRSMGVAKWGAVRGRS